MPFLIKLTAITSFSAELSARSHLLSCRRILLLCLGLLVFGCSSSGSREGDEAVREEVAYELGRRLFYEQRLSATATKSCAGCHNQRLAFTDGYRRPPGILADLHFRNTPTLLNVSRQKYFNWANTDVGSLSEQLEGPLFGRDPLEMGLSVKDTAVLQRLSREPVYRRLLGEGRSLSWELVKQALAVYVNTLNSYAAPYDRYKAGHPQAISASAKEGERLFFSPEFNCAACHVPPLFGADSTLPLPMQFANVGLYNHQGGNYPATDQGLFRVTGRPADKGRFRTPTLRNLQYTAPYFHDGSAETLEEALDVFYQGGRNITYGMWQGDGRQNPYKSPLVRPLSVTALQKQHLLDFLQTLNDTTLAQFQSPYEEISQTY